MKLPQGVQDYLGAECYNKGLIERKLSSLLIGYGYERIETAAIEYMDAFRGAHGSLPAARMFKTTDADGELIVLRPDATLQVSRIVADKYADCELKRFFYLTDTYVSDSKDYNRELAQVGVELIGSDSPDSDVEIVELAVRACLVAGLDDFQIEIGHINYFYGLLDGTSLDDRDKETVRKYVNKKDLIGASVFLRQKGVSEKKIEALNMLPYLFGGEEVLDEAERFADGDRSVAALARLRAVLSCLKEYGLDRYITVDLGMVKTNNYYSGLVLRGISQSLGHALIDGGRYDRLSNNHGIEKPAVGLSVWMKRLLIALDKQGALQTPPAPDVCVVCLGTRFRKNAYELSDRLRSEGKTVLRYFGTVEDAQRYCAKNGIRKLIAAGETAVEREVPAWNN